MVRTIQNPNKIAAILFKRSKTGPTRSVFEPPLHCILYPFFQDHKLLRVSVSGYGESIKDLYSFGFRFGFWVPSVFQYHDRNFFPVFFFSLSRVCSVCCGLVQGWKVALLGSSGVLLPRCSIK